MFLNLLREDVVYSERVIFIIIQTNLVREERILLRCDARSHYNDRWYRKSVLLIFRRHDLQEFLYKTSNIC